MTIKEALEQGLIELKRSNTDIYGSCLKQAQILLSFAINQNIIYLHTNEEKEIQKDNKENYLSLIKRACNHEPIEYITNKVSFYSKDFFIDTNALIPRAETELLIENLLDCIRDKNNPSSITEIGTGSGIISTILATELKNANFIATDISEKALLIANKNASLHNVAEQISFINTSLLDGVDKNIDILISNPPYIKNDYQLPKNVLFEPRVALFGGEAGDEILKKIIDLAYVKNVKILACEIGYDQKEILMKYINKYPYKSLKFYQDFSKYDRGFILKIKEL